MNALLFLFLFVASALGQTPPTGTAPADLGAPAVPELNSQLYRPVIDANATLWNESSGSIVSDFVFRPRFVMQYVNRPFVYRPLGDDRPTSALVSDVLQLDAIAAAHYDRVRFAVDLPVYLFQAGQSTQDGAGLGDIALDSRVTLVDGTDGPVGVGVNGRLGIPSSTVESPLGNAGVDGELFLSIDGTADQVYVGGNLGARFLPVPEQAEEVAFNDQLVARFGAGYAISDDAGISADLVGQYTLESISEPGGAPMEALVGGWGRISGDWMVRGGVGRGLTGGIGSPQARILAMVSYDPGSGPKDRDGDGIVDANDACPDNPEDKDGYKDDDGCPDASHPVTVEVRDANGGPLPAAYVAIRGGESVPPGRGTHHIELHPGSFMIEATHEGYLDQSRTIEVPAETAIVIVLQRDMPAEPPPPPAAELGTLVLVVTDPQGTPLPSASWMLDGQPGPALQGGIGEVPLPGGNYKLVVMADGFATQKLGTSVADGETTTLEVSLAPSMVVVTRERIDVKGTIYFDTNKASIKPESFPLLNEVAETLKDHEEIKRVRIEGHTDARGSAAYNKTLSEKRAASVRTYLVERGVFSRRLTSVGMGEEQPVDPRDVPEAWDKNRRVDFFIEERDD